MDALDLARLAADENRYRTAQKAAARQQAEDEMPGPVVYQGYDAGNAKAIVRSLGNNPVEVGEIVTNGGLKPGQRVDASRSPGRVAIDAMPRVKPQPLLPEPKAQPQAKFAFLYNAVIEDAISCFVGGFLPRSEITASRNPARQIHFLTKSSVIGGVKIPQEPNGREWQPQAIAIITGKKNVEVFYKDQIYAAQPIGYGLWLAVIDFPLFSAEGGTRTALQPYLSGTTSLTITEDFTQGGGSGTAQSI